MYNTNIFNIRVLHQSANHSLVVLCYAVVCYMRKINNILKDGYEVLMQ